MNFLRKSQTPIFAAVVLFSAFFLPGFAADAAREIGPHPTNAVVRPAADTEFDPQSGADHYDIYLNGIQLGRATMEVKKDGPAFVLQVVGKVRSLISDLFMIRYKGHAVMTPDPVQPSEAVIEEQKGARTKTYFLNFLEPNRALAVTVEEKPGKAPKRSRQEFVSKKVALDPFSAVFFLRSFDWRVGDVQVFDILTGKKQYELKLDCQGETVLTIDGRLREAWEIVLESRGVEAPRKVRLSGVIYLSKDSRREILKITGEHKIGKIAVNMRKRDGQKEELL